MTIDRLSGAFLVLLGLFVAWERRVLPLGTQSQPGPGYFPLLLAILLMILGSILVFQGKAGKKWKSLRWSESRHALAIMGCTVFVTAFLESLGYRISMILVLGCLFLGVERLKLWVTLILTLGLALGSFWVFDTLLKVPLPRGAWGF